MKRILAVAAVLALLAGGFQLASSIVSPTLVEAWGGPGDDPESDWDTTNDDDADGDDDGGGDDDSSDPDE